MAKGTYLEVLQVRAVVLCFQQVRASVADEASPLEVSRHCNRRAATGFRLSSMFHLFSVHINSVSTSR